MVAGNSSASPSHTTDTSSQTISSTSQANLPRKPDNIGPSWETAVLLASLKPNHLRSLGTGRSGEVLPDGAGTDTLPDCSKGNFTEGTASNAGRNSSSASKAGHSKSTTIYGPVHQQALCDWQLTTPGDKLKASELLNKELVYCKWQTGELECGSLPHKHQSAVLQWELKDIHFSNQITVHCHPIPSATSWPSQFLSF